jgi:hypothetical protein
MWRVWLAGLLGGLALFGFGALLHTATPLGDWGIQSLSPAGEDRVAAAVREGTSGPGFYFFPGMDTTREPTAEEQASWAAKYRQGPTGILVVRKPGGEPMSPAQLGGELASNVLAALAIAFVLWHVPASVGYLRRVLLAGCFGLFAAFEVDASYWVWYGFPTSYFLAQCVMAAAGALVAGILIAWVARR